MLSGSHVGLANERDVPDRGGADVGQALKRERRQEPHRLKMSQQPSKLLQLAEMHDDADNRGEQQEAEQPGRDHRSP